MFDVYAGNYENGKNYKYASQFVTIEAALEEIERLKLYQYQFCYIEAGPFQLDVSKN